MNQIFSTSYSHRRNRGGDRGGRGKKKGTDPKTPSGTCVTLSPDKRGLIKLLEPILTPSLSSHTYDDPLPNP